VERDFHADGEAALVLELLQKLQGVEVAVHVDGAGDAVAGEVLRCGLQVARSIARSSGVGGGVRARRRWRRPRLARMPPARAMTGSKAGASRSFACGETV
jgi:hypothetical protein